MADRLDASFAEIVELMDGIMNRGQHLVITGIGKSGIIGNKIASTFSSIGLPTIFLHAAEASHGDLGLLKPNDTLMMVSNSGETAELITLLPAINRRKCTLVALTGAPQSTLGQRAHHVLNVGVREEACTLNLVPTASTTATLAMGDALAMALLAKRGFKPEDFAQFHPGGSLGRRLLTTVDDLMHAGDAIPTVSENSGFFEVLHEMSSKRLGSTLVTAPTGTIKGIITDGDIRRLIEKMRHSEPESRGFHETIAPVYRQNRTGRQSPASDGRTQDHQPCGLTGRSNTGRFSTPARPAEGRTLKNCL